MIKLQPVGHHPGENFINADRQTLLQCVNIRRVRKPVDLSVICLAVRMETMLLHQLQQVSNVKNRIGPRTEPCGTPNNTANETDRDAAVRTCCVRPIR